MVSKKKKTVKKKPVKKPVKKPAKKKPVKKKPAKKKVARPKNNASDLAAHALVPTNAISGSDESDELENEDLRRCAAQDYIFSRKHISVLKLAGTPFYKGRVKPFTMERWAGTDRWTERRSKWAEEIRLRTEQALGTQLTQERISERLHLLKLKDAIDRALFRKAKSDVLSFKGKPKSVEGLIDRRIKISQWLDTLTVAVGEQIPMAVSASVSEVGETMLNEALKPDLTEEEMIEAADAVVRLRMAAQDTTEGGFGGGSDGE